MAHTTAPPGYGSNYAAIVQLIKFGYAIWTPAQMAVLLFHAERSTAIGKDCDQHSETQATNGIYSHHALQWIRGPAGVGRSTWHRANAELETTAKNPSGVLRRSRQTNRHGRDDATEWAIDWHAVKAQIEKWKEDTPRPVTKSPGRKPAAQGKLRVHAGTLIKAKGSHSGRLRVPPWDSN